MLTKFKSGNLEVRRLNNRSAMGQAAADTVALAVAEMLYEKEEVNMVFAAAPSQEEFLAAFQQKSYLAWDRINAFHMDEYIGLAPDAPQRFGVFLRDRLFEKQPFKSVNYINGTAADTGEECARYTRLLEENKIDIVCMGIGENGHLAFNDPPVADFEDPFTVKVVELDDVCRQQQVNDGCFASKSQVPVQAITLTIPALLNARRLFVIVPGPTKAQAVYNTLYCDISTQVPSTILRNQPHALLFTDQHSGALLQE